MNINDRKHRLVLIKIEGIVNHKRIGTFRCDCGNEKKIIIAAVKFERTKSCGCLQRESLVSAHKAQRGEYGVSCCRSVYNMYRCSARRRALVFEISYDRFKQITKENCTYCGSPPTLIKKHPHYYGEYVYNGMDRKDSSIGYIEINVTACCKTCNYMKLALGEKEFLAHIEKIHQHQLTKVEDKVS